MTRRDFIVKWMVYGLMLLPVWFAEQFVFSRITPFEVSAVLLPIAVVAVAVLEGSVAGAGFGLVTGVLWDAVSFGSFGAMTLGLTLVGMGAGIVTQYVLSQSYAGYLLCSAAALALLSLARMFVGWMTGTPVGAMLRVAVPELLWSLVFTGPIYLMFRWVHRRTKGSSLF